MISTGSLSAFSNANLVTPGNGAGLSSAGISGAGATRIRDVRLSPANGLGNSGSGGSPPLQSAPQTLPSATPGQALPRGSLLNLSV